ncbi:MAG: hypothetical protein COA39_003215 [Sulfurimonas sp.]|nr:hypothetical protein [Sulfurimonas sp.]
MINELSDTFKVKLYDYAYTPFMSSFIISWIVINHKYILIYFSNISEPEKKLELLSLYGKNHINAMTIYDPILPVFQLLQIGSHYFWYPLSFALFYVFTYPFIANFFYSWTRKMNNEKKKIKLTRDNKVPINQEERDALLHENYELREEIEQLNVKLSTQNSKYNEKIKQETSHLNKTLELERKQATDKFKQMDDVLNEKNQSNSYLESENEKLKIISTKSQESREELVKYKQILSTNGLLLSQNEIAQKYKFTEFEVSLLQVLNNNNFSTATQEAFINTYLMEALNLKKIKAEHEFKNLLERDIITLIPRSNLAIKLSDNSKQFILKAF